VTVPVCRSPSGAPLGDRIPTRTQLVDLPKPEPLIVDTLEQRTVAALAGRNSTGKSFLALDWACCIATGKPWQGREVTVPGQVLYVAAEGASGIDQRVSAWEHAWGRRVEGLEVYPRPLNLHNGLEMADLLEVATAPAVPARRLRHLGAVHRRGEGERQQRHPVATNNAARLTTVDTAVLLVAHTDATDSKVCGATALEDDVDTVYRSKGDAGHLTVERTKRKDGPHDDRLHLWSHERCSCSGTHAAR
jgi:hypothetical protein